MGVDAHKATSHITIMDDAGKVVQRKQVPTSHRGLRDALEAYHELTKTVLEASHRSGSVSGVRFRGSGRGLSHCRDRFGANCLTFVPSSHLEPPYPAYQLSKFVDRQSISTLRLRRDEVLH